MQDRQDCTDVRQEDGTVPDLEEVNMEPINETIQVKKSKEVLSFITGVTYSNVPSWYGYTARDLKLDLILPKRKEDHAPCPVIVWLCGGAFMVCDRTVWLPELVRFARAGYAVASVEYRCSNEVTFPEPLIDIKTAIRFLKAHAEEYCLDAGRFYVMGESAGGTMAALVGTTGGMEEYERGDYPDYDSSVQGIVDFYGPTDFDITERTTIESTDNIPDWSMKAFLGCASYQENREKASAVHYVSAKTPPCMILHGLNDKVVNPEHSRTFYETLIRHDVYAECWFLEDAVHGDDLFFQDEMVGRILQFLQKIA